MKIHISKLDAAKSQLESSIRGFFHDGDPISIHALTSAAHEVLEAICKKQGVKSIIIEGLEQLVREDKQKEVRKKINIVKNFIKHADRDPAGAVEFDPEITQYFIWDACRLYKLLTTAYTKEMLIFTGWMALMYPDLFVRAEQREQFQNAKATLDLENKIDFYNNASVVCTKILAKFP